MPTVYIHTYAEHFPYSYDENIKELMYKYILNNFQTFSPPRVQFLFHLFHRKMQAHNTVQWH